MRVTVLLSILFHVVVVAALAIQWPNSHRDLTELGDAVAYEVVVESGAPPPPAAERLLEPIPEPPQPEPPPPSPPPDPTPPEPEPEPELKPEPEPPPPALEPEPAQAPPVFLPPAKPEPPEAPATDFASAVLNTLTEVEDTPPPPPLPEEPATTLNDAVAAALGRRPETEQAPAATQVLSHGLTDSELAIVRDQIIRCWNPPAGAADVRDMLAVVAIDMKRDKTVLQARVTELSNSATKQFGESVVRAVLRCQPLKLPDGKYDEWNKIILTFSPRDMVF